ncbi:MAG: hypothetical protein ACLTSX_11875 [Collinsella sp.]
MGRERCGPLHRASPSASPPKLPPRASAYSSPCRTAVALGAGPARYWAFPNAVGTVGFISASVQLISCESCNRLRLTADGTIRPCLFSDAEYPVREALRSGDEDAVRAIYRNAIARKPRQHDDIDGTQRFMSQIGG